MMSRLYWQVDTLSVSRILTYSSQISKYLISVFNLLTNSLKHNQPAPVLNPILTVDGLNPHHPL
jgi:hypothetical protein